MAYSQVPSRDAPALPEYLARKDEGPMDAEDLRSIVQSSISQCVQFVDNELSVERARATEYYLGKPFGNEEEGRSQVILTEVADAVDGMMPSLLRVAFPVGEHAVEFAPNKAEAVELAEQQTDYVRYVIEQDNSGFMRARDVIQDGLVRKIGIFKWGWDSSVDTKAYKQEGISQAQLEALAGDDDVDLKKVTKIKPTKEEKASYQQAVEQFAQQPQGQPPQLEQYYDIEFTRTTKGGKPWVDSVPPEEFIYNRQARRVSKAIVIAHRTEKTRGQLLAMGISAKDIDDHAGANDTDVTLRGNAEEIARRDAAGIGSSIGSGFASDPEQGSANQKLLYTEAWMTVDYDGDGIAELRRICCIGSQYYPVKNDPTDEVPFSVFTPLPEAHTMLGRSISDRTMDVQKINSSILRGILDSAALSIFPRMAYLEGQASVADIMNTAIGAPMRERVTGAIRPVVTPFTGGEMLPVLTFMQGVVENRIGQDKGSAGLDSDALQSTGKEAVAAVLTAKQQQLELIARIFCEMTLKPLFEGVARMLIAHQPRKRVVRLRGKWTEVDPRSWDNDMDVVVNVALGTSFTDKKIATLMAVASDQKEFVEKMGVMNPMCDLPMLRQTRAKILALQGIPDADSYYKPFPPGWKPDPPPAPQPSPDQLWVQAEKDMAHQKTMKELAIKADSLALDRDKAQWDHEFRTLELAANTQMKKYAADATNKVTQDNNTVMANIEAEAREADLTLQGHDMLHGQMLDRQQHEHDKAMDVRAADTADTAATQVPE